MKKAYLIIFILFSFKLLSQNRVIDSLNQIIDSKLSFTVFNDNYFITGSSTNESLAKIARDAKFQISFKQRLTRSKLPLNSYLYLTYTQKSFWNIYNESSPFAETNYNPSIGIGRILIIKNKLISFSALTFDHESNGRDSIYSRSWNRIIGNFILPISKNNIIGLKVWIPFSYKTDNPDLLEYVGYGELNFYKKFNSNRVSFDLTIRKGMNWTSRGSIQTQVFYRLSRKNNQYFMIQFYNGYAENLINYQKYSSMIRFGFVLKPDSF